MVLWTLTMPLLRFTRVPRSTLVLASVAAGVLAAGCSSGSGTGVLGHPLGTASPSVPPVITITPADGAANVRLDTVVTVHAEHGVLDKVLVHPGADPTALEGSTTDGGSTWTATHGLTPGTAYVVEATAHGLGGGGSSARASFTTMVPPKRLVTDPYPGDGSTVGIGMPLVLKFESPVAADKQAGVVQHISVTSVPAQTGAWHWFSPTEVHWRPKDYWQAGTKVTVTAHLTGVDAGNGVWGQGDWSETFSIGAKHYSVIDAAAHQMQVFDGDQLVHTYPVSTGNTTYPTISGTLVVWYKLYKVHMVSTGIGIPLGAPGSYDEDVFYDTAISTDGFYIHAAPWSVWAQGNTNVSHGCVNLSTARAIEFYNFSQVGDVVVVKNTPRPADGGDGEADWQIPFAQYDNTGGAGATESPAPANSQGGGL